jgi:hypothetical protein
MKTILISLQIPQEVRKNPYKKIGKTEKEIENHSLVLEICLKLNPKFDFNNYFYYLN